MKFISWAVVPLVFLLALAGTAFAGTAAGGDDGSLLELARPVLDAVLAKDPGLAAALALVLVAAAARRYGGKRWAFLNTDAGGALTVLVGSFGGAVAAAFKAGMTFSPGLAWTALGVAAAAAGGWKLIKSVLVDPWLGPLADRHAWLRPVKILLDFLFKKPDPIAAAVAAGDAAVKAKPAPGPGVDFRDVP